MTGEEREMYRSDDYEQQQMFAAPMRSRIGPDGKEIRYQARVEQGVKITVKSKAQAASAGDASAATSNVEEQPKDADIVMTEEEIKVD